MANTNNIIQTILLLVLIGIILYLSGCPKKDKYPGGSFLQKTVVYLPDTIHKGTIYIPDTQKLLYSVFPQQVIYYKPLNPVGQVICDNDSLVLVIDSLNKIIIPQAFLLNSPQSAKLLSGKFDKDAIILDLLLPSNQTFSLNYPVDFSQYTYRFNNGGMQAAIYKTPFLKRFSQGLYVSGGYNYINSQPLLGIDYNIDYQRLRFSGSLNGTIGLNTGVYGNLKFGYKIR